MKTVHYWNRIPVARLKHLSWPVTFKIYPDGENSRYFYIRVNIWPTKKAMYEHRPYKRDHLALWSPLEGRYVYPDGRTRKNGLIGEINFWIQKMGTEVITHEVYHATRAYAHRVRMIEVIETARDQLHMDMEEVVAGAHGRMCRQLVGKLYDFKILPL
jgi:hypothetical protein